MTLLLIGMKALSHAATTAVTGGRIDH